MCNSASPGTDTRAIPSTRPLPGSPPATRCRSGPAGPRGNWWTRGIAVGRLVRSYETPGKPGGVSATVLAIGAWDKTKSDSEYQSRLNADRWEVVIPELEVHP